MASFFIVLYAAIVSAMRERYRFLFSFYIILHKHTYNNFCLLFLFNILYYFDVLQKFISEEDTVACIFVTHLVLLFFFLFYFVYICCYELFIICFHDATMLMCIVYAISVTPFCLYLSIQCVWFWTNTTRWLCHMIM